MKSFYQSAHIPKTQLDIGVMLGYKSKIKCPKVLIPSEALQLVLHFTFNSGKYESSLITSVRMPNLRSSCTLRLSTDSYSYVIWWLDQIFITSIIRWYKVAFSIISPLPTHVDHLTSSYDHLSYEIWVGPPSRWLKFSWILWDSEYIARNETFFNNKIRLISVTNYKLELINFSNIYYNKISF